MLVDFLIITVTALIADFLWTKFVDPWLDERGW